MRGESKKSREIFVMVTNQCNLACSYCYEPVKNRQLASPDAIKAVLAADLELHRDKFTEYFLVFHGGEPFLAFEAMKELAEWFWNTYPELNPVCMTTTNGTLLTDEIRHWLIRNRRRFVPILSLDGQRDSHNLNRSGSWDRIDRGFFRENWPAQAVKMTVAPNVLNRMFDNFSALTREGFRVNPSLAKEVDWDPVRDLPVFAGELKKFTGYYLSEPDLLPCELLNIPMQLFDPEARIPFNRACGAGGNVVAYDVQGRAYPCHAFIGNPDAPYNATEVSALFSRLSTNNGAELSPGCSNCSIHTFCSPCYGLNYTNRSDMAAFDPAMCRFTRLRVLASAGMFAQMITSGRSYHALRDKTPAQLRSMLNGIQAVFRDSDMG